MSECEKCLNFKKSTTHITRGQCTENNPMKRNGYNWISVFTKCTDFVEELKEQYVENNAWDVFYSTLMESRNYITTVSKEEDAREMCLKNNKKLTSEEISLGMGTMFFIKKEPKCKICGKKVECAGCSRYTPGECVGRVNNEYCDDCCPKILGVLYEKITRRNTSY